MKQKKVNGVLKGAFAFGAALGGAGMITDMDIVYAEELKNESEASLDEEEFEEAATSEAASEAPEEEVKRGGFKTAAFFTPAPRPAPS